MTIPRFAAFCAAAATILIFVGVWTIEQAYGALIEGKSWTDMSLPLWAVAALLLSSAAVAAITAWFFAREFQNVLVDFTRYLEVAQVDPSARLSNVSFVELRRLRSVVIRSVGKLRRDNDALRRTAYQDPRTGMPNLIALEEHITKTLPRAKYETPAALIVLDLDNFTRASERLGALASEAVLKACGQRMTNALDALEGPVRAGLNDCMLAAMQADSFALYLPSAVSRDYVSNIARAIRLAFADPFIVSGQSVTLGISGGIVIAPEDADTMHKLFRHAELALRQVRNLSLIHI